MTTTVVVSGAIANKYLNGGEAWVRLSWVLGLRKLGFRVYFLEQIGRDTCLDAAGNVVPFEHCENLAYFKQVTERFGLADSAALIYKDGEQVYGSSLADLFGIAEAADLLVNISGHLTLESLLRRLRRKAYVDIDPGFTQFWHAAGETDLTLEGHDFYFTIGENIGTPFCAIPTGDLLWRRTRQPVVLEHWPPSREGDPDRFTTVASWRGPYGRVQYGGETFGLKVHEFRRFIDLPGRTRPRFEIALDIHPAEEKVMQVRRPLELAGLARSVDAHLRLESVEEQYVPPEASETEQILQQDPSVPSVPRPLRQRASNNHRSSRDFR